MFTVFLQKTHQDRLIAHLYEHVFLIILSNYLRDYGFLPFLDYEISGETFDNKIILKLKFYNKELIERYRKLLECVENVENFTKETISCGISQIAAEKMMSSLPLTENDAKIMQKLILANWQEITPGQAKNAEKFYKNSGAKAQLPRKPARDFFDFTLSVSWRNSLAAAKIVPLVQIYAKILSNLAGELLENRYCAYVYAKAIKNTTAAFAFQSQIRFTKQQSFSLAEAQKNLESLKTVIEASERRIIDGIKDSTEDNALISRDELPKNIDLATMTYQEVKDIATAKNARLALSVLTVSLQEREGVV